MVKISPNVHQFLAFKYDHQVLKNLSLKFPTILNMLFSGISEVGGYYTLVEGEMSTKNRSSR